MSQALYTAMSGISSATTDLEVISNNVANINTTAFKSSSVNFSDVYSTTMSYGSVASGDTGGTNPIQVGVGAQVSAISKDFTTGSSTATGKSTDLMIQGNGFFTVLSSDGAHTYYTRAGDFGWDDSGNLVTSSGAKVFGAASILSSSTSGETVYVPTSVVSIVEGNPTLSAKSVEDLNALRDPITSGIFHITVSDTRATGGSTTYDLDLTTPSTLVTTGTMAALCTSITTQLDAQAVTKFGSGSDANITVACNTDGTFSFTLDAPSTTSAISFGSTTDTSNFVTVTNIGNATLDTTDHTYTSKILDYVATISNVTSAAQATSINSETINADGSIQGTYADGNTLSVQLGSDGASYEFIYTTADGVKITQGNGLTVSSDVAVPANFVIQIATITNTDGMISVGSNLYEAGPNSGNIIYTVGSKMGAGSLKSGYLEASNVDLSDELSKMILAQRAVQANSRVFTTVSDTMNTIVQMGR